MESRQVGRQEGEEGEETKRVEEAEDKIPPQRTILYARRGAGSQNLWNDRQPLPVPNWFDLPVLLPESNAVAARIQTTMASRATETKSDGHVVKPKTSRLTVASPYTKKAAALRAFTGPRTEEEERKVRRMGAGLLKSTAKRRQSTRVRKLDELDPRGRRRRLREKLWKDLSRFGLWPIMGPGDYDDQQSVEDTVDSILAQWQQHATETPVILESTGGTGGELGDDDEGTVSADSAYKSRVFLTDVPATVSLSTAHREKAQPPSQQQLSVSSSGGAPAGSEAGPEDESNDHERGGGEDDESEQEDLSPSVFGSRRLPQKNIGTPGLERRRRLHNLHQFVGTQLQKRLFKAWDSIEIAFTGSGDMTVSQIVKFLQLSDVQLGATDAAKVQSILEQHVVAKQVAQDAEVFGDEVARRPSNQKPGNPKLALLSYEGFRQLFRPADAQVASRWKREFDREKFRHEQEKDIYNKELTALEEKGTAQTRFSHEHLSTWSWAIPWGNDQQRLQLRAQFLEIIFQKPHRRRMLHIENALPNSGGAATSGEPPATASAVPEKLSAKLILSTLLQKYSRNGHFESIEVPVAAFLYHDFAADAIKKSIQAYWASSEIDQWPERQMIFRFRMKKQTFRDWHKFTKHIKLLREYVLRKFVAWKYMTRRLHEYYAFYRTTFWPFYTWKRHLQQMIIARGKTTFLTNAFDGTRIPSGYSGSPHGEPSDAGAATSLTRIMETDLGEKIKRKSRLYDLCLGLYLKYRDLDRGEMVGNVIAYRRFGRIFLNTLRTTVRHGRKNRFATDLGAFRVMNTRFRQWMEATIYKLPPTQEGLELVAEKTNGSEKKGDAEVLHWLRDREWRLRGIENNPMQAQQLREDLLVAMANDSVRKETIRDRELLLNKKQANEDAFLRKEASATLKMKAAQMQQVQQILRRRALRLHDALDHVYDDLLQQQSQQQLKSSFRSLRIVVMMKYTSLLCHRAQLRNWLRLCHRFMYWEKHMSEFYKQKVKYHAFQALLKHAVWKWKFQSPGLSVNLQRSKQLMLKYEHFIEQQGLLDGSSSALQLAATKHSPANTLIGVFLRWVQFAQCSRAKRNIILLTHRKRQVWLMHTVFHSWKNRMKVKYTYLARRTHLPFLWRQSMVDLDTYHCSILALEARLPTTQLKATLHRTRLLVQQTAIGSPTLKRLFQRHETEVRQRLQLEKRLMFVAYRDRRVHTYVERSSAIFGASVGVPFVYEKAPPYGSVSEIAVISDKKVDGIMLVVKTNASVSLDGTLHGNPFGTREVFTLPKGEKLVAVEGFASKSIYGLRFGTSSGRFSKWFGHCEKGTHFEIRSDYAGKHEEIVGIFGHADSTSINSLGVVMRHTTLKNPFEGLWLQDDHQLHHQKQQQQEHQLQQPSRRGGDELLCDRQFVYFLQVRTCEVLLIMKRAHAFALRAHRLEAVLPSALGSMRVIMALARWLLNALSHGLVHCTDHEEEGRQVMQSGLAKHSAGEKLVEEGVSAMQVVDGFRDADGRLDAATLGVKKVTDLREMMTRAQQLMAQGRHQIDEGQGEIVLSQRILPHLPMTKRMTTAIRKMYKVVQTKDYIDQMDPELRAILLLKKDTVPADELVTQGDCLPAIVSLKMAQTIALSEAALADGLMIRRHIQRGDFYPQLQIKCWKHIVLELRDLPCFFGEACVKASSREDTPQVVGTTSPSRGKLRPGKDLIVLPDAQAHEPENNASTPGDGANSNASSSWKPRPNSTASYSTRREPASIDLISAAAMGKTFSGLSLLERQMEWLRKKQDKMEAERIRQEEENVRELTFQPKLIRRITFSGDKGFKDISSASSARPYSRSESSRRVTETAGATLLRERALPRVPRLAHHRRSKKKTLLQSAAISQPVGVSCKLLDSMKSELEASLATTRSNASSDASTSEQSDDHEKQESDPVSSGDDGASPSENSETSKEGTPETEAEATEAIAADDTPPWSAKPTIGGRRVDFDSSDTKARLTLRDASKFELSTMYRKTDRRAGREGVALHVGRHEDTLEEQVIAVLFDKEKVSEEDAERWWKQHEHRFVDVLQQHTSALPPVAPRAVQLEHHGKL
ncbi:hypothetical protein BBJ28_00020847 [Nothophytophthora sp. Chile5]|nr:hypothetical protein BBJ28_00020847 [Nothophytophthora sp. Chile5]